MNKIYLDLKDKTNRARIEAKTNVKIDFIKKKMFD